MSNLFGGRGRKNGGPGDAGEKQGGAEMAETDTDAATTSPERAAGQGTATPRPVTPATRAPQRGQPRLWQELGVNEAGAAREGGEQRQLVIGHGVEVRGTISNCDEVIVEGSAQVEISAARLSIRPSGRVTGSAHVMEAVVDGEFDGELTVDGDLSVTEAGCVNGTVAYGRLEIGLGGRIIGDIQHGSRERPAETPEAADAAAASA